ncbi:MAG: hypothetical protein ABRQ25_07145 [Clostridiaceae bacterium]
MKKRIFAMSLCLLFLCPVAGCQPIKKVIPDVSSEQREIENLNIMPFNQRRFIYTNGMDAEIQQFSSEENGVQIEKTYPKLNGLKNKDMENKINQEIQSTVDTQIKNLKTIVSENAGSDITLNTERSVAGVGYNCNNVIFIEYYVNIGYSSKSGMSYRQKNNSVGYDLNTGNKLQLKDLFKKNSNYEKLINQFIFIYLIENNYDDPDSNYMSKPFQGIRKGQSFSFDITGIRIIMDEKNDEFIEHVYPNNITIPLKVMGDELAVFDRYFDAKINHFEKNRTKKLLPNQVEYKQGNTIREEGKNYNIYIQNGEFFNVDNAELKTMLNSLTAYNFDVDGFRARAQAQENTRMYYGTIEHRVNMAMNAGGYMSLLIYNTVYENGKSQEERHPFNYDLNRNKIMKLKDVFAESFDYKAAISNILCNSGYYILQDGSAISKADIKELSEDEFYFDEYGVTVYLNISRQPQYANYYIIQYEKIGLNNLEFFNAGELQD